MTALAGPSPDLLSRASLRRISHDSSRWRLRVSFSHHRDPSGTAAASRNGRMGQPSWGFVHRLAPGHSDVRHPGYFVHLAPRRTSLSTFGALWVAAHVLLALPGPAWAPCFATSSSHQEYTANSARCNEKVAKATFVTACQIVLARPPCITTSRCDTTSRAHAQRKYFR